MAINWIVALTAVPWSELVQAAPGIVKGARNLFTGARERAGHAPGTANTEAGASTGVEGRLAQIEATLAVLGEEQRASAELIRSLADQNARVVQAMAAMQARARIVLGVCIALVVAVVTLAIGLLTR